MKVGDYVYLSHGHVLLGTISAIEDGGFKVLTKTNGWFWSNDIDSGFYEFEDPFVAYVRQTLEAAR